jgi:anti-anti-sigma factor
VKIETQITESGAVLRLSGRLDAAWAGHFHGAASELVRDGHHRLRIDASDLEYLSSAGLRTLLRIRRDLDAVNGSLAIVRASPFVRETLRMSGLETLLAPDGEEAGAPAAAGTREAAPAAREPVPGMHLERHVLDPGGRVGLRVHAAWKPWDAVRAGDLVEVEFPRHRFGLGIGAPGSGPDDARGRLGDFAAAAGCLAWLPGDGAESPDYLEQEDRFIPRLHAVQALAAEGAFSHLLRFRPDTKDAFVSLEDLLEQALQATGSGAVAAGILAEIDGLVGAALARSPGLIRAGDRPGDFPEIRNWIAFCGERLYRRSLALVVAFAARDANAAQLAPLAPMPFRPGLRAHAHAVVLPFRPLSQGVVDFESSVRAAFAESSPLGLLHLLGDDRPIGGLGQSTFIRGACWCAPLQLPMEPLS